MLWLPYCALISDTHTHAHTHTHTHTHTSRGGRTNTCLEQTVDKGQCCDFKVKATCTKQEGIWAMTILMQRRHLRAYCMHEGSSAGVRTQELRLSEQGGEEGLRDMGYSHA
jgi:hypothetical protein